jgi:hypothetical protein
LKFFENWQKAFKLLNTGGIFQSHKSLRKTEIIVVLFAQYMDKIWELGKIIHDDFGEYKLRLYQYNVNTIIYLFYYEYGQFNRKQVLKLLRAFFSLHTN